MAIYTQLSITATPGKRQFFSAKSKGIGPFTALSVSAVPGAIHSFTAKTPAVGHEGLFTALSVIALPGGRHVFLPKAFVVPPSEPDEGGGGKTYRSREHITSKENLGKWRKKLDREDEELLEIVAMLSQMF